jgi:hypothetical protein
MRKVVRLLAALLLGLGLTVAVTAVTSLAAPPSAPAAATPAPWRMFHRNEQHTGVITDAVGAILPGGPLVRWTYRVFTPTTPVTNVRWAASMPLGDLNGDGTLEVVVTTPGGSGAPDRVLALRDMPGQSPAVQPLWVYTSSLPAGSTSYDQYSSALVDADGDGLLDVVFSDGLGVVRALKGSTGQVLWAHATNHAIESGPMVADLEGDGKQEIIVVTDCNKALDGCPGRTDDGALYVFAAYSLTNNLIYSATFPYKMDSAEPVIADLDPTDGTGRQAIVLGTWGGYLLSVWRTGGAVVTNSLNIRELVDPSVPMSLPSAIRSSPLIADFGEGPTAVFGWVPNENSPVEAYLSAVGLVADMDAGTLDFTPRWSYAVDAWKSSVALLPATDPPLVVAGYGIAVPPNAQSGIVGGCDPEWLQGGIIALTWQGHMAWHHDFGDAEGNIRGSVAVADLNNDGRLDVVLPVGCYGALKAYDGLSGELEWVRQLGPRTQASPSLGDLNGDGKLEIVVASYDGLVYVLEGGARVYLPGLTR